MNIKFLCLGLFVHTRFRNRLPVGYCNKLENPYVLNRGSLRHRIIDSMYNPETFELTSLSSLCLCHPVRLGGSRHGLENKNLKSPKGKVVQVLRA